MFRSGSTRKCKMTVFPHSIQTKMKQQRPLPPRLHALHIMLCAYLPVCESVSATIAQSALVRSSPGDRGFGLPTDLTAESHAVTPLTRHLAQRDHKLWGNCCRPFRNIQSFSCLHYDSMFQFKISKNNIFKFTIIYVVGIQKL